MGEFSRIKQIFLDLDGTLYFKGKLIPGAAEAVADLRGMGYGLLFLTNTDSVPAERVRERIEAFGIRVQPGEVFSPVEAALDFMAGKPGRTGYCLVAAALRPVFAELTQNSTNPDYLIIGDMRDSGSYAELNQAFRLIMGGAAMLALSRGRHYYAADGPCLDTGAFVSLFEFASGQPAVVLGKPSRSYMDLALARCGARPEEVLVVGDDPEVDLPAAAIIGATGALVRTGGGSTWQPGAGGSQPDLIIASIAELPSVLRR